MNFLKRDFSKGSVSVPQKNGTRKLYTYAEYNRRKRISAAWRAFLTRLGFRNRSYDIATFRLLQKATQLSPRVD